MKRLLALSLVSLSMIGCNKPDKHVPTLTTNEIIWFYDLYQNAFGITDSMSYTCRMGGRITSDCCSDIISKGVCWSTSPNPTVVNDTAMISARAFDYYINNIQNIAINNTYYVRAFAINSNGTGYGNELSFNTNISGCTDSLAINYNPNATVDDGSCRYSPIIGDSYQGGIVFYLDGNGGGLIAAPYDQSTGIIWAPYYGITGAGGTAIGTGYQNTIDLLAIYSPSLVDYAAEICANLVLGGYSDWFLPSKDELNEMYENIGPGEGTGLGNIGGFETLQYWSSSDESHTQAWSQYFSNGGQVYGAKFASLHVRAIRAF